MNCPVCKTDVGMEVERRIEYGVYHLEDKSGVRYTEETKNMIVKDSKKLSKLYKGILSDIEQRIGKKINEEEFRRILVYEYEMDRDMTEDFLSKLEYEGALRRNGMIVLPK